MRKITPKKINRYDTIASPKNETKSPSITLDLDTLPEAKKWKVGESYEITLEVTMTGIKTSQSANKNSYDAQYNNNATFDITGVEVDDDSAEEEDAEEDDADKSDDEGKED